MVSWTQFVFVYHPCLRQDERRIWKFAGNLHGRSIDDRAICDRREVDVINAPARLIPIELTAAPPPFHLEFQSPTFIPRIIYLQSASALCCSSLSLSPSPSNPRVCVLSNEGYVPRNFQASSPPARCHWGTSRRQKVCINHDGRIRESRGQRSRGEGGDDDDDEQLSVVCHCTPRRNSCDSLSSERILDGNPATRSRSRTQHSLEADARTLLSTRTVSMNTVLWGTRLLLTTGQQIHFLLREKPRTHDSTCCTLFVVFPSLTRRLSFLLFYINDVKMKKLAIGRRGFVS